MVSVEVYRKDPSFDLNTHIVRCHVHSTPVYYQIFGRDEAFPSKRAFDPTEPTIGRVLARTISPTRTVTVIKNYIAKLESLDPSLISQVYANAEDSEPVDDLERLAINSAQGPGASALAPIALILRDEPMPSPTSSSSYAYSPRDSNAPPQAWLSNYTMPPTPPDEWHREPGPSTSTSNLNLNLNIRDPRRPSTLSIPPNQPVSVSGSSPISPSTTWTSNRPLSMATWVHEAFENEFEFESESSEYPPPAGPPIPITIPSSVNPLRRPPSAITRIQRRSNSSPMTPTYTIGIPEHEPVMSETEKNRVASHQRPTGWKHGVLSKAAGKSDLSN